MRKKISNIGVISFISFLIFTTIFAVSSIVLANNYESITRDVAFISNTSSSNCHSDIDINNNTIGVNVKYINPSLINSVENTNGIILDLDIAKSPSLKTYLDKFYLSSSPNNKIIIKGELDSIQDIYRIFSIKNTNQLEYDINYYSNIDMKIIGYSVYKDVSGNHKLTTIRCDKSIPEKKLDSLIYTLFNTYQDKPESVIYHDSSIISSYNFADFYNDINIFYSSYVTKAPNSTNKTPIYELYTPFKLTTNKKGTTGIEDIEISHIGTYDSKIFDYMPGTIKPTLLSTEIINRSTLTPREGSILGSKPINGGISSTHITWKFPSPIIYNPVNINPITEYRGSTIASGHQLALSIPTHVYMGKGLNAMKRTISTIINFK
ncbi:MAG: hypothetical protein RR840_09490 [Clostridium sp.]